MVKIIIGGDHAAVDLKEKLKEFLESLNIEFEDFGTHSEESCDYPDIAHPMANYLEKNKDVLGIAICGSANGISMALNKHQHIRAAICWNKELAELARLHNNANVLSLPARFIDVNTAKQCVDTFMKTDFEGGRHERRVNKIPIN